MQLFLFLVFFCEIVKDSFLPGGFMKSIIIMCAVVMLLCGQAVGMRNGKSFDFHDKITALAALSDGPFFAVGIQSGEVFLGNTQTGKFINYVDIQSPVTALAIGQCIAIGYLSGEVGVLDRNMRELHRLGGHEEPIRKMALDNGLLATVDNCLVKVWDISSGNCLSIIYFLKQVDAITLSATKNLFFASVDKEIIVWDIKNNRQVSALSGHENSISALVIQDSMLWSASYDGTVRYWDIASGNCVKILNIGVQIEDIGFSLDNHSLIICSKGLILAYDVYTGTLIDQIFLPYSLSKKMAIYGNKIIAGGDMGLVRFLEIADYKFIVRVQNELNYPVEQIKLFDRFKRLCNKPCSCEAYKHLQIDVSCRDTLERYALQFTYSGEVLGCCPQGSLIDVKDLVFTYDIKSGGLMLQIATLPRTAASGNDLSWVAYTIKSTSLHLPTDATDLALPVYTVGKEIKSISLSDSKGNTVHAEKDAYVSSLWNILKSHHYAPYLLKAETDDMVYHWQVPFLCEENELMLYMPSRSIVAEKQDIKPIQDSFINPMLMLYMEEESSIQQYKVPLIGASHTFRPADH